MERLCQDVHVFRKKSTSWFFLLQTLCLGFEVIDKLKEAYSGVKQKESDKKNMSLENKSVKKCVICINIRGTSALIQLNSI